jgi:hypothetical protein
MNNTRAAVFGFVGAALIVVGLLALWFPVHLGLYDPWGMPISCGRGINATLSQAPEAQQVDVVGRCESALLVRRLWAIPSAVAGWILLTVVTLLWIRSEPETTEESTRFWELRGDAT